MKTNLNLILTGSLLFCACETVDFSACEDALVVRQQTGDACPLLECACEEFLRNGRILSDGCYEYEHPVTGEETVDCECRLRGRQISGGGSELGLVPMDRVVDDLDLAVDIGALSGDLSIGGSEEPRTGNLLLIRNDAAPMAPECEAAAEEGNCARLDCLCEWFITHLEDGCLIYDDPETGVEVVDCGCHLGRGGDDDGPSPPEVLDGLVGEVLDRNALPEPAGDDSTPHGGLTVGELVEEISDGGSRSQPGDQGPGGTHDGEVGPQVEGSADPWSTSSRRSRIGVRRSRN